MMLHPLCPDRVRKIRGSFAFIEHRFLHDGFWADLGHHQLLLYLFLVMVADRFGLSYYSYDKICTLLRLSVDDYIDARNTLIEKDLLGFDGQAFPGIVPARVPQTRCKRTFADKATNAKKRSGHHMPDS